MKDEIEVCKLAHPSQEKAYPFTIYDLRFESEALARKFGRADAKGCDETVRGIGSKGAGADGVCLCTMYGVRLQS